MEFSIKEWTKTTFYKISDASEAVGSSSLYSDVLFIFGFLFSFFFSHNNFIIAW